MLGGPRPKPGQRGLASGLPVGELRSVRLDRFLAGLVGAGLVVELVVVQLVEILVGQVLELLDGRLVDCVQPLVVLAGRLIALRAQPPGPRRGRWARRGIFGALGVRAVGALFARLFVHPGQSSPPAVANSAARAPGSWLTKSTIDRR